MDERNQQTRWRNHAILESNPKLEHERKVKITDDGRALVRLGGKREV